MTNRLMYKQIVGDSGFKAADTFNESDHPRADNGQFGSGGGGKAAGGESKSEKPKASTQMIKAERAEKMYSPNVVKALNKLKEGQTQWVKKGGQYEAVTKTAAGFLIKRGKTPPGVEPESKGGEAKKEPSFIEILNNPEAKRIVHQIEEMGNNPDLKAEKAGAIAELKQKYNFTWKE